MFLRATRTDPNGKPLGSLGFPSLGKLSVVGMCVDPPDLVPIDVQSNGVKPTCQRCFPCRRIVQGSRPIMLAECKCCCSLWTGAREQVQGIDKGGEAGLSHNCLTLDEGLGLARQGTQTQAQYLDSSRCYLPHALHALSQALPGHVTCANWQWSSPQ